MNKFSLLYEWISNSKNLLNCTTYNYLNKQLAGIFLSLSVPRSFFLQSPCLTTLGLHISTPQKGKGFFSLRSYSSLAISRLVILISKARIQNTLTWSQGHYLNRRWNSKSNNLYSPIKALRSKRQARDILRIDHT